MVSLTRSFNTNSGVSRRNLPNKYLFTKYYFNLQNTFQGATFFSESLNMEDRQLLQPILDSYGIFKPLKTVPIFSFHLLFTLVLDIIAIVYAIKHPDEKSKCREYFIIIYLHIALWFFTLVSIIFLLQIINILISLETSLQYNYVCIVKNKSLLNDPMKVQVTLLSV